MKTRETVTRVIDGDTFVGSPSERPVRLSGVNAPEADEPGGAAATTKLTNLIAGKVVDIEVVAYDEYSRRVAKVWVNGVYVNDAVK